MSLCRLRLSPSPAAFSLPPRTASLAGRGGGGLSLPGAFPAASRPGHPYGLKEGFPGLGQGLETWSLFPHPKVGRPWGGGGRQPPPPRLGPLPPILSRVLAQSPKSGLGPPLLSSLPSQLFCSALDYICFTSSEIKLL